MKVPYALQTRRLAESQRYLLEESDYTTLSKCADGFKRKLMQPNGLKLRSVLSAVDAKRKFLQAKLLRNGL